ncbi:MAG: hypothetical protein AAFY16_09435 [Cyanobacteria bacterium J06642_3]
MSETTSTPEKIWIITGETSGSRDASDDTGGVLGNELPETQATVSGTRKPVEVEKLKREMRGFLQAMREMLDEAEPPDSKMQLDEVELSVEINAEGQVSLLGVGGKAGGKGGMTFKFKRK